MAVRRDELAEALIDRENQLRSDRGSLEALWQQIARYIIPREATFIEEITPGVERSRFVLDSTAPRSLELFGSFIHTLMCNMSTRWYNMSITDQDTTKLSAGMKQWKEDAENTILRDLGAEKSGFYSAAHQVFMDQGAFGTGPMFVDMVDGRIMCRHFHLADVCIDEDTYGNVDSIYRQFKQTPRQAQQRWPGVDLGKEAMATDGRQQARMPFMHSVFPSTDEMITSLLPVKMLRKLQQTGAPFVSVWTNKKECKTIAVGSFDEMPYMVPRWYKVRGELYGRSPATTVLPDVRMVNRMLETILRGAEKLVDPPLVMRDGALVSPVRLFPGAITFTDGDVKIETLIPPGASRVEYATELLKATQEAIRQGFFVPLFMSPESPVKTATQVLQETQERNRAVSPMLVRMQNEFFHPLGRRVYGLESRSGRIKPPPEVVTGVSIEYISPLMSSQRELEALGVLRMAESLAPWAQIDPEVFIAFDPMKAALIVHAGSNVPASILRTDAQVKAAREVNKQKAQLQQMTEAAKNLAPAVAAGAQVQAAKTKGV